MWESGNTGNFGGSAIGGGGGGFVANSSFSSPRGGGDTQKGGLRKAQNIFPVTVRQLLECTDDTLRIEDSDVNTLTIVGIVRKVETSTTKVSFVLDDQTGTIEAINYVGTDDVQEPQTILVEGTYGRVVGALRSQRGQKYIIIYKLFPVTDMNEVTCHHLEVIEVPLKLKKLKEMEDKKTGVGMSSGMDNTFSTSMVGGGFGSMGSQWTSGAGGGAPPSSATAGAVTGLTANQNKVLNYMKKSTSEMGVVKGELQSSLGMNEKQVGEVIEFLSGEGLIYSTIDDDHYKITD